VNNVGFESGKLLGDPALQTPQRRVMPQSFVEFERETRTGQFQMGHGIVSKFGGALSATPLIS
jgi:hypothetical protein